MGSLKQNEPSVSNKQPFGVSFDHAFKIGKIPDMDLSHYVGFYRPKTRAKTYSIIEVVEIDKGIASARIMYDDSTSSSEPFNLDPIVLDEFFVKLPTDAVKIGQ